MSFLLGRHNLVTDQNKVFPLTCSCMSPLLKKSPLCHRQHLHWTSSMQMPTFWGTASTGTFNVFGVFQAGNLRLCTCHRASHQSFFPVLLPVPVRWREKPFMTGEGRVFFLLAVRGVAMAVCASHRSRHRNVRGDVCKVGTAWGVTWGMPKTKP